MLVGRDAELARIDAVLDAPESGPGLVIRGPRGSGVTALVAAAAAGADEREMTVIRTVGVEAEAGFPYAGLHQLLRPLGAEIDTLATPQRDALRSALDAGEADRGRVTTATVSVLSIVARAAPVLVCVDEAQWLDDETCAVLTAVARRAVHEPAAVVIGTHDRQALEEIGCAELSADPLEEEHAAALLDALEPGLERFVRARVLRHAAGNPLALTELPAAYRGAGDGVLLSPSPPLTPRLEEAFGKPLEALAPAARTALLHTALGDGEMPAEFAHPLVRATVIWQASPAARQAAQTALGDAATDPARAAWHRAAAAAGTDEAVAADLAAAARDALAAGAYELAAFGMRRAARLTPGEPQRSRRLTEAADLAYEVGAWATSDRLLEDVDPATLDTVGRAHLIAVRQRTTPPHADDRRTAEVVALARATAEHGERPLALRLLWRAAAELQALDRRADDAAAVIAAAEDIAGDPAAPAVLSMLASLATREREHDILEGVRAHAAGTTAPGELALLGHAALITGEPALAFDVLARAEAGLRREGRLTMLGQTLTLAAWAAALYDRWDRAEAAGAEAVRLTVETGLPVWGAVAQAALAMVAGLRGDEDAAEDHAGAAERVALPARASAVLVVVQQARGRAALSAGRPGEAFEHLRRAFDSADPAHDRVSAPALLGDLAEAAATPDQRAAAARILAAVPAARATRLRVAAAHARLALAEDTHADAAFATATAAADGCSAFDEGRMLLVHGMRLRRQRRVADSRAPLRRAAALFTDVGAAPWAERAGRELAATAETSHRAAGEQDQLTPQELQIAHLVARGRSNRDIAADLALSPRTVGHHLTRIFRKLGVSSRAGVAGALERQG